MKTTPAEREKRLLQALESIRIEANFSEDDSGFYLGEILVRIEAMAKAALSAYENKQAASQ